MRTATALSIHIALAFCLSLGLGLTAAHAQDAAAPVPKKKAARKANKVKFNPPDAEAGKVPNSMTKATTTPTLDEPAGASGESLKFNTDTTPPATDNRPTMKFADPGATPLGQKAPNFAEAIPDEEPYKAYIGYPKNRFGASLELMNLSSQWNYNGRSYNFPASPIAYGVNYGFFISPIWQMGLEYSHYSMSIDAKNITPNRFHASTKSYDEYYFKTQYCVVSHSSFYRQFCPGLDIGKDSYPILTFQGQNDLYLGQVNDIIIGLNLNWQIPFGDRWGFKAKAGYNYGTGMGNSGALTSKSNNSIVGSAGLEYSFPRLHSIYGAVDYKNRSAKIKGKVGINEDTWTTNSSLIGFKAGYNYTFP